MCIRDRPATAHLCGCRRRDRPCLRPEHPVRPGVTARVLGRAGSAGRGDRPVGYLFTEVLDGRNAHVTDGVLRALGRAPRDFTDYAGWVAGSGGWQPAPAVVAR